MSAGFRSRWLEWTPDSPAPPVPHEPAPRTKADSRKRARRFVDSTARALSEGRTVASPLVCFSCWGSDFWTGRGVATCRRCHPPVAGAEVRP